MSSQFSTASSSLSEAHTSEISKLYVEGMVAGIVGAVTIAVWFLLWDTVQGRPLYTPSVLGTALFGRGEALSSPNGIEVSLEMTLMYTWVHGLVFAVLGGIVSRLLGVAERNPDLGFGIVLLFVVLQFGFIAGAVVFVGSGLSVLSWPAVLFGNILASTTMAGYLWRQHPNLDIRP